MRVRTTAKPQPVIHALVLMYFPSRPSNLTIWSGLAHIAAAFSFHPQAVQSVSLESVLMKAEQVSPRWFTKLGGVAKALEVFAFFGLLAHDAGSDTISVSYTHLTLPTKLEV